MTPATAGTYVVGDVHGHADRFAALLRGAGLVDEDLAWSGGGATLVLLGDFCDRGPRGAEAIALARRLEREADAAGGRTLSLVGNHDLLLLAAARFGERIAARGDTFREAWLESGGEPRDLERVDEETLDWLATRPALLLLDDTLFAHGDCGLYLDCGNGIEEVNRRFVAIATDDDPDPLDALLDGFGEHRGFQGDGRALAERTLRRFGGRRIVHGHTPVAKALGVNAWEAVGPYVYHDGLCINADPGLYLGSPGFVLDLDAVPQPSEGGGAVC